MLIKSIRYYSHITKGTLLTYY